MKTELNVLIVDDSEEDAILIMRELTRSYNAIHERVKSADEMSSALEKRKWDIVICDYIMPGFNSFAANDILKKMNIEIPFIVVSGKVDEETAVEVMKAGANDYVQKDRIARLLPAVKRELADAEMRIKSRKISEELDESNERYLNICESASDMIFAAMFESFIVYSNPSFQKAIGYTSEELLKVKVTDIVHPEYIGYWNSVLEKISASEKREKIELCLLTKKMHTVYVEGDCGVKYDKNGKMQLRGILHDVTVKRQSEEMKEKYKAIVNTSSEFMSMINSDYVYEAVNDAYCAAQGMEREQILGKTVAEVWGHKVFKEHVKENIDKCFDGQKIKYKEWIDFPKIGRKYHEVSLYPYMEKDKVVNVVIVTQDITNLDKMEAGRKQYIDGLSFLSKAAMGFIELAPESDIFKYVASCLEELVPESIIVTCAFMEEISAMKVKHVIGIGENIQKVMDIAGKNLLTDEYKIDEAKKKTFANGKLFKLEGGVHELSCNQIPRAACKMIERLFNITDIYAMGFTKKGELFGDAMIILKHELSQDKKMIIETFINQASAAMFHRKAEDNLKSSEERMRILFDFAPDAYALCDFEGNIIDCNRAFKKMTGYRKEEIVNKQVMELVNAKNDNAVKVQKDHEKDMSNGFVSEEYVIKSKDGKEIIAEITKFPLKVNSVSQVSPGKQAAGRAAEKQHNDTAKNMPNVLVIMRDITEKKRFVEEIRKLAKFVYENPSPMLRISKEGKLIYANPSGINILNDLKFEIDKTVPKQWATIVEEVIGSGQKKNIVLNLKERLFSFEVVPLSESGYVNFYGRDITESEMAEKALRESEEKYRTLFEESKDMVVITTPSGKVIDINRAGIEMMGYRDKQKIDDVDVTRDIYSSIEDRKSMLKQLQDNNYIKDFETVMMRKDGAKFTALLTSTTVLDAKGNIKEIRSIVKDITERRHMEAQLAQLQKMESLGMLAGGIAHDFNNLLTGIIGNVSDLKGRVAGQKEFADDITGIEESAKSAAGLTNQLLAFARGGKYIIGTIDLNNVMASTVKIITSTFNRNINVDAKLDESIPCIEADSVQIGQVVMNLCSNARDAMPHGGELTIRTGATTINEEDTKEFIEAKPGKYVYLSIADNGMGMDKETSRRIFEPFFTTKGVGSGTGLGLSVVYGIIKNHGGMVRVKSEPGKGSEFKVYLPASNKILKREEKNSIEQLKGKGELILVVDDEKEIRMLVKRILEKNGYKVLIAENGDEALGIFNSSGKDISLVILDMVMPNTDSEEVMGKMKEIKKDITVLVSTGYIESEKTNKMIRGGAMGIIQKPFNVEGLLTYTRDALSRV